MRGCLARNRAANSRMLASDASSTDSTDTRGFPVLARIDSATPSPLAASRAVRITSAPCDASARALSAPEPARPAGDEDDPVGEVQALQDLVRGGIGAEGGRVACAMPRGWQSARVPQGGWDARILLAAEALPRYRLGELPASPFAAGTAIHEALHVEAPPLARCTRPARDHRPGDRHHHAGPDDPPGQTGTLQADLSCTPSAIGVFLDNGATLAMNGHVLDGCSVAPAVSVAGADRVLGPGSSPMRG